MRTRETLINDHLNWLKTSSHKVKCSKYSFITHDYEIIELNRVDGYWVYDKHTRIEIIN